MDTIAFYIMNTKGLFVLNNFIGKFGVNSIGYVVSEQDKDVHDDSFQDIKKLAQINNIPFYQRKQFDNKIESKFSGLKIAIGWRWIINNEINLIIFHDSLLPKYRGFAPLVNSLINKEKLGGVTALFADSNYDRGAILAQRRTCFDYPIKIIEAIRQIEPLYFDLVDEIWSCVLAGEKLKGYKQDDHLATYSLWLDHEDYFIDWSWTAEKIQRFIDAVGYPFNGAKAMLKDEVVYFNEVGVLDDVLVEHRERHIGKVILVEQGVPVVICQQGLLVLKEITDENGNELHVNFRSRFK